jgi:hypothetical protein
MRTEQVVGLLGKTQLLGGLDVRSGFPRPARPRGKLLVGLAEERGTRTEDGIVVDLQLSRETLVRMVGGSRPTVNQIP